MQNVLYGVCWIYNIYKQNQWVMENFLISQIVGNQLVYRDLLVRKIPLQRFWKKHVWWFTNLFKWCIARVHLLVEYVRIKRSSSICTLPRSLKPNHWRLRFLMWQSSWIALLLDSNEVVCRDNGHYIQSPMCAWYIRMISEKRTISPLKPKCCIVKLSDQIYGAPLWHKHDRSKQCGYSRWQLAQVQHEYIYALLPLAVWL